MKKQFYEKVLPTQGVYCAAGIKDGKVRHRFAETLDQLMSATEELTKANCNVYVAPNSFEGHSRRSDSAKYSRSFFVDLDVNHGTICYASQDQALDALHVFLQRTGLPPPVRVNSGTGVQAYWLFHDDVPAFEWKPYAEKFKDYCIAQGLKIDPSVTGDAARIMRCPNTYNYKTDPPNLTYILDPEIYQYDFGAFKELLGEVEVLPDYKAIIADSPVGEDDSASVFKDNYEYDFSDIVVKSLEGTGCGQIKYLIENAATAAEPLWYAGLSVAVRCVDGAEAIHMMSEDYPGYSHDVTERKAQQSLKNAKWAHSCDKFDAASPNICTNCPHKGQLRSNSPIDLGRKFAEAPPEPIPSEDAVREVQDTQAVFAFPDYMKPFIRGRTGGVYHMPPPDADGNREDPVCLTANDLYPIKRMWAGPDKECLLMRHVMPMDPVEEFLLPLKHVYAFDKLKQILSENGVNFHVSLTQRMFEYITKWDVYLQRKERAEIMRMQMGWTEPRDVFVIGDIEIARDGVERSSAASPMVRNVSKLVRRVGSYELWKEAANGLNAPGFEIHALGLFQGFGSILMVLTTTPGASICYQSTDSGVGKTGGMYAGLSVFCDPYNVSLLEGLATDNAHIGRYLGLKNMLFGIDEASNIAPDVLSKMLHRISQGKAKLRMQSSVNAERDLEMSASMQGAFTSNQSLYDKLFSLKTAPQGELARLIEFPMKKPKALDIDPLLGIRMFDPFRVNYGWAGPEYIKHLFKVGDIHVLKTLTKWIEAFIRDYGGGTEYRFYMNTIATCFAGAELAMEAGIIQMDLERIYQAVIVSMIQIRDKTIKPGTVDYKGLVTEFYYKNLQNFLIFNAEDMAMEYRGNILLGRIDASSQRVYINKAEFKKFLAEKQVSSREFEVVLEREKLLLGTEKRRLSSGWKAGTGATPPINVYVFASLLDVPTDTGE
ncbi:MAG: DUF927 domain-containing protein [Planctomycetes bacterium]|jgi:hypothetical protein|nr:DUF927 domain-containing protein [Planctomycetota bacterium]